MTATASQFGIWSNRAQPAIGTSSASANLRQTNADGRVTLPVWGPIVNRSRTWQDLLGFHGDSITVPAQDFDTAITSATFTALDVTLEAGNANLDVTIATASFSALNPTFEAVVNFDTSIAAATFTALSPTFEAGNANLDVAPPIATFSALNPVFEAGNANLDVTPPVATFSALDPVFEAGNTNLDVAPPIATFAALDAVFFTSTGPQLFDSTPAILTATAFNVIFEQPAPPIPSGGKKGGGSGGVPYWIQRTELAELAECIEEERTVEECLNELIEKPVERRRERRNRFLAAVGGLLFTMLLRRRD